ETGLFPVHARWGEEGTCAAMDESPDPRRLRARMPGRFTRQRKKPLPVIFAADPGGERVRPPDSAPYLDPSLLNTAPPSQKPVT
ncbi:hypothetical protein M9458_045455, partial [Cirrhinus mrigala]